jgi:hypothetical protein
LLRDSVLAMDTFSPDVLLTLFLVDAIGLVVTIEFGECPTTNTGIGQAMTVMEYKGHRIEVSPVGKGCMPIRSGISNEQLKSSAPNIRPRHLA